MVNILIVDDELPTCLLLKQILESRGYHCCYSLNVPEARKSLCNGKKFHLIISDIRMPGESGMDLLRWARSRNDETGVLMMSVMDDPETAKQVLDFGAYGLLPKPFDSNEALIHVNNALRRRDLEISNRLYLEKMEALVQERTEALHASEKRYRILVETMNEGLVSVNAQERIDYVNDSFCEMLGHPRENLTGQLLPKFLAASNRKIWREKFQNNRQGQGNKFEITWKRQDGSQFISIVSPTPLYDDQDLFSGCFSVVTDISSQKEDEDRLKKLTQSLKKRVDELYCFYGLSDVLNKPGQTREEILQKTIDLLPDAFKHSESCYARLTIGETQIITKKLLQAIDGSQRTRARTVLGGKDMHTREMIQTPWHLKRDIKVFGEEYGTLEVGYLERMPEAFSGPFLREEVDLLKAVGERLETALENIEAQETIREQARLLQNVMDAIDSPIFIHDQPGLLIGCNAAFESFAGAKKEIIIGKSVEEISPGNLFRVDAISREDDQESSHDKMYEARLNHSDGTVRNFLCNHSPFYESSGDVAGMVGVMVDITDRKRLEQKLLRSQKMESIGQLAAGIAHEINTPMQYVGDNTLFITDAFNDLIEVFRECENLLDEKCGSRDAFEKMEALKAMKEEMDVDFLVQEVPKALSQTMEGVDHVTKIVRSMKQFAHPGKEGKSPSDINKAIEATITVARNEWKYVADMKTDLDQALPPCPCVVDKLNQVLLNMIVNAAHSIAEAKSVNGAKMGSISISTRTREGLVEIRIADTGMGIPEQVRSKIFDPFFTTKDVGQGTGQGLAIAHSVIVELHGGSIDFNTETGKGTEFVICLPLEVGEGYSMAVH